MKTMLGCAMIPIGKANAHWDRVKRARLPSTGGSAFAADINRKINERIRYTPDKEDHWQTPNETIYRERGDCEDIAILKRAALIAAGYPEANMALVIGYDNILRANHAVLALGPTDWQFLDNVTSKLLDEKALAHFKPLFAFTEGKNFIFAERKNP